MRTFITLILLCTAGLVWGQVEENLEPVDAPDEFDYYIIEGDSIPKRFIDLDEVLVLPKLRWRNTKDRRTYLILRRKTRKVYPYAKLAAERLTELNARLEAMDRPADQRRYARIVNRYLEDEFKEELKKLTKTEGQILIKLIHRQTGITAFELVKNLRSGWKAFWYNTTASMFDISLKEEYNPSEVEEDYLIEDILQRAFQSKALEEQESALDFNYMELTNKWVLPPTAVRYGVHQN
ncbi:DUF4294 domain-containing protein [Croceiramulus getboli]